MKTYKYVLNKEIFEHYDIIFLNEIFNTYIINEKNEHYPLINLVLKDEEDEE